MEKSGLEQRHGFMGWNGFGGSIFQWHPELKIGFGYVPTDHFTIDFLGNKGSRLQNECMKVVRSLK
jgi:hypothetical protein